MSMMMDVFSVSWSHHEEDRTDHFKEMRENQSFVDVTLVCDDDQLEAHKVLLSAASPFFCSVLQRNPHSHPLLYLRGILKKDLSAILNYIYSGEAKVPAEDLDTFMALARDLKVRGLVDENETKLPKDDLENVNKEPKIVSSKMKPKKRHQEPQTSQYPEDSVHSGILSRSDSLLDKVELMLQSRKFQNVNLIDEVEDIGVDAVKFEQDEIKSTQLGVSTGGDIALTNERREILFGNSTISELDEKVDSLIFKSGDGLWSCKECSYNSKSKSHVREHVENHIEGYSHPCQTCGKVFNRRVRLRFHVAKCQKSLNITM